MKIWSGAMVIGGIMVSCSASGHLEWIVEMTFGRYMWLAAAFLIGETCKTRESAY